MPSKTKLKNAAIAAKSAALPKIPNELLDQFVTGPMTGEAVNAASMAFKKALIERVMGAELGHHLGYAAGAAKPEPAANQRNGRSAKTVLTGEGPVRIEVPRDRDGSFEPILIPKHERRFTGFDDKIIAMYARGMTMTAREQAALREVDRINHAYAHTALKPLMPALLLGKKVAKRLREVLNLIAKQTYLHRENLSKPRKPKPKPKPHKHMVQKPC